MPKKYYSGATMSNIEKHARPIILLFTIITTPYLLLTVGVVNAASITYSYDNLRLITDPLFQNPQFP